MNNGKNFFPNVQSTETGTWTKGEQQRTYKKKHKPDNTKVKTTL